MNNLEDKGLAKQIVSIKKVLVAVDLSHHSEATAFYAAGIANQFGASLTIVHVYELYRYLNTRVNLPSPCLIISMIV